MSPARHYARAFGKLRKADIPNDRAALLEQMAAAMDAMPAAGTRDEVTGDQHAAACVLRQIAATERGWILVPVADAPAGDVPDATWMWQALAGSRDHSRRARLLGDIARYLRPGPVTRSVLEEAAGSERAAAGLPRKPVMIP